MWKLAAGAGNPTALPFADLRDPPRRGRGHRRQRLHRRQRQQPADEARGRGSTTATPLPFTDLNSPAGVAVDTAGDVYVADRGNNRVMKLAAGQPAATAAAVH